MKTDKIITASLLGFTACTGLVLGAVGSYADTDTAVDQVEITVPTACTMNGSIVTGQEHTATLTPGTYSAATGSEYVNGIGKTTLTTFCNDNNGFSIYAIGYTGNNDGTNTLIGTTTGSTINTKAYESTDTESNWSMKVNKVTDTSVSYNPQYMTITNSFDNYHAVPNDYTKVAEYKSTTEPATTDTTLGAKVETTYAAYVATNQPADTYTGKVKYVMVHPYTQNVDYYTIHWDGNGMFFDGDPNNTLNNTVYDAKISNVSAKTYYSHGEQYDDNGTFIGYAPYYGNDVLRFPGASTIHIAVTYGTPPATGGPPSDLLIWAGDHPDYTNSNNDTSITSCGAVNATDGAFKTPSGVAGTQVTMECDIPSDAVTFYDYGIAGVSVGYYAVVTGMGGEYSRDNVSGVYKTPSFSSTYRFLGWSEDRNATEATYTDEADFLSKVSPLNTDPDLTLYAVWDKSFDAAFSLSNKTKYNGYYKMQDATPEICNMTYDEDTIQLIDLRDGKVYNIQKLKDGNCWMLDNLALDLMDDDVKNAMYNTNGTLTNASYTSLGYLFNGGGVDGDSYAKTAISTELGGVSDSARVFNQYIDQTYADDVLSDEAKTWKFGMYYNYCAARAGSNCGEVADVYEDICPTGWRMPTGSYEGEYSALYNISDYNSYEAYRNALHIALAGHGSYSLPDIGTDWQYWSSTPNGSGMAFAMNGGPYDGSGSVIPNNQLSTYRRGGVRCIINLNQ